MRRYIYLLASVVLFGCKDSKMGIQDGVKVEISTLTDNSLNVIYTKASEYEIPYAKGYNAKAVKFSDESVVYEKEIVDKVDNLILPRGEYTLYLTSLNTKTGFDEPIYKGEAEFSAVTGDNVNVEVTTKLECVVVDVDYSENVKNKFVSVVTKVWSVEESVLEFSLINEKLGYFALPCTKLYYKIEATTAQGYVYSSEGSVDKLKNADLLQLNFDIKEGDPDMNENMVFSFVLDRVLNEQEKVFELGTTLDRQNVPVVVGRLLDLSKPVGVKYGVGTSVKLDVVTPGGLDKIFLIAKDRYDQIPGFHASIVELNKTTAGELNAAIEVGGEVNAKESLVDLSGMTKFFPGSETSSENFVMSIGVLDKLGQYSVRDIVFNVFGVSVTTVGVENNGAIDWFGEYGERNKVNIKLKGRYNVATAPDDMQFYYREVGANAWSIVPAVEGADKSVSAIVGLPASIKEYEFKLTSSEEHANEVKFPITVAYPNVVDMSFENWTTFNNLGVKNPDLSVDRPWTSSNNQAFGDIINVKQVNGRTGQAIRLESIKAGMTGIYEKFASGAFYTGTMVVNTGSPHKSSLAGMPFKGRPKALKGYFKYKSKTINEGSGDGSAASKQGQPDQCEIAVKLEEWNGTDFSVRNEDGFVNEHESIKIGYGQLCTTGTVGDDWVAFEIPITYYNDKMPDHIIITSVSSRWGGYLTGGVGSVLQIDDYELVY